MAFTGGVGAACAYLFDPERGPARRARLTDQVNSAIQKGKAKVERKQRYDTGVAVGEMAEAHGAGTLRPADDIEVVNGIKQVLAAMSFSTSDVTVEVVNGKTTLRGQVADPEQLLQIESEVTKVPGVSEIRSFLHLEGTPAPNKASALQAS